MGKKEFLTSIFASLVDNNIAYFVVGEYKSLPDDTGGSDIDIVILENKMEKSYSLFRNIAKQGEVIIASEFKNDTGHFLRFLSKDWGVQIDLFNGGFFYNGVTYYNIEYIKPHVIEHNGIKVLNTDKAFFVDYFKEIIHNGKSKEKYRLAVMKAFVGNAEQCRREIREMYGENAVSLIDRHNSLMGLNYIGKQLRTIMRRKLIKNDIISTIKSKIVKCYRLFLKKPGYVIAVLGTDGSGKSTIINAITPWIDEGFHSSVKYNHLRPNCIPDMAVLLGKRKLTKEGEHKVVTDPHAKKQSGLLGSLFRWGYYMIDYTIGYLKVVWLRIKTHSTVFIFDRYYYDYYIDQKRSRTNLPNWIIRLGELFVPKPDLILCLGGDPEKIYNRKPETSLEEVKRQTSVLKSFCDKHSNAVWIDTTLKLEESITAAKKAIFNTMSKRFN